MDDTARANSTILEEVHIKQELDTDVYKKEFDSVEYVDVPGHLENTSDVKAEPIDCSGYGENNPISIKQEDTNFAQVDLPPPSPGIPEYVALFDKGDWESLDKILRTPIQLDPVNKEHDVTVEDNDKMPLVKVSDNVTEEVEIIEWNQYCKQVNGCDQRETYEILGENLVGGSRVREDCDVHKLELADVGAKYIEDEIRSGAESKQDSNRPTVDQNAGENWVLENSVEMTYKLEAENIEGDIEFRTQTELSSNRTKTDGNEVDTTGESEAEEDEDEIKIAQVSKHKSGKRYRNKHHCCKFCQKLCIAISRHIVSIHKDELEIAKALALNNEERRKSLEEIVREGDFYYNKEVLATGKGELILVRRPTAFELKTHTYQDYGPCTNCLGFMLKDNLWHHAKYGCKASSNELSSSFSVKLGSEVLLAAGLRDNYSEDFEHWVVGKLSKDEVGLACKKEVIILKYGDFLFQKNQTTSSQQRGQHVRSALRSLVALHLKLKRKYKLNTFLDVLDPIKFDFIVQTVKEICQFHNISKKGDLKSPSSAIRLGLELVKIGEFVHGLYIKQEDIINEKKVKRFIHLVKSEWNTRVSRLLLTVDRGHTNEFAGRTLEDITIDEMSDLEEDVEDHNVVEDPGVEGKSDSEVEELQYLDKNIKEVSTTREKITIKRSRALLHDDYVPEGDASDEEIKPTKPKKPKATRVCVKKPWSPEEKTAVLQFFRKTIAERKGVQKVCADECIKVNPVLNGRTWLNVRDFVRNYIRKL